MHVPPNDDDKSMNPKNSDNFLFYVSSPMDSDSKLDGDLAIEKIDSGNYLLKNLSTLSNKEAISILEDSYLSAQNEFIKFIEQTQEEINKKLECLKNNTKLLFEIRKAIDYLK